MAPSRPLAIHEGGRARSSPGPCAMDRKHWVRPCHLFRVGSQVAGAVKFDRTLHCFAWD